MQAETQTEVCKWMSQNVNCEVNSLSFKQLYPKVKFHIKKNPAWSETDIYESTTAGGGGLLFIIS